MTKKALLAAWAAVAMTAAHGTRALGGGLSPEAPAAACEYAVSMPAPEPAACSADETDSAPEIPSVEPLFVRALTGISAGHNDYNPVWSPSGRLIAFERNIEERREIHIVSENGAMVSKVYYTPYGIEGDGGLAIPGIKEEDSFNSGISWAPAEDRFVFMSNAAMGNYDIYLRDLKGNSTVRLTNDPTKDGQADWSPVEGRIAFVSGRSGKAEVYILDLAARKTTRLTRGEKEYLYPQWSPDGRNIAMIYGSNGNHKIEVIYDIGRPRESARRLTTWRYDDLRPVWSPDGKKIAFYTNYNVEGDPARWSIAVVDADGSGPTEGEGLAASVVAANVVPDMERGPAWLPDGKRIAYVKNDGNRFNPIYIVNAEDRTDLLLKTNTKMNHDVSCSSRGILAFRAQAEQWDHIYLAGLRDAGVKVSGTRPGR